MRQFYENIRVDTKKMRFYAECTICGKRQYGTPIPLICRNRKKLALYDSGKADRLSQALFNHAKASAVQYLARFFNQCRKCYRFVCDNCYDPEDIYGACRDCSETKI